MSFGPLKRRKTGSPDVNLCTSSPELSQKSGPKALATEKPSLAPPIPRTWCEGTLQGEGRPTIGKEDVIPDDPRAPEIPTPMHDGKVNTEFEIWKFIETMIEEGKKLNEEAYSLGQEGGGDAPKERDPVLQHLKNTNFTTLPTRSTAGTRFAYWLENHSDPKTKKRDAAAPNNKAREQIRLEWAKAEFEKEEKLFQETKSWSRVDSTKGEYLPPDMVYASQGGYDKPEARRRGDNILKFCCTLQGDFLKWNNQSKGYEFLVLKQQWREVYEQKWLQKNNNHDNNKDNHENIKK